MSRTLKIEDLGDRWHHRISSGIRLKGRWLVSAGFPAGQRVTVAILSPGAMELRVVSESETAEQHETKSK
jgi:hypothetical protein